MARRVPVPTEIKTLVATASDLVTCASYLIAMSRKLLKINEEKRFSLLFVYKYLKELYVHSLKTHSSSKKRSTFLDKTQIAFRLCGRTPGFSIMLN